MFIDHQFYNPETSTCHSKFQKEKRMNRKCALATASSKREKGIVRKYKGADDTILAICVSCNQRVVHLKHHLKWLKTQLLFTLRLINFTSMKLIVYF